MAESFIGPGISINGEIAGFGELVVQGTIRGKVELKDRLLVEKSGKVEAEVESINVEVQGMIVGNVHASEKIEIKPGGKMIGDVKAPRILIADGAVIKGKIDMDAE